ncbi:uncharacterized protein [Diadema antillarum]|uniref:uncharacterized protein n=1 Tax=Diadema antillarum TaxID=105358 RepID=UPI003A86A8A0
MMDSTPEFPHVATSPGELSPEAEEDTTQTVCPIDPPLPTVDDTPTVAPAQGPTTAEQLQQVSGESEQPESADDVCKESEFPQVETSPLPPADVHVERADTPLEAEADSTEKAEVDSTEKVEMDLTEKAEADLTESACQDEVSPPEESESNIQAESEGVHQSGEVTTTEEAEHSQNDNELESAENNQLADELRTEVDSVGESEKLQSSECIGPVAVAPHQSEDKVSAGDASELCLDSEKSEMPSSSPKPSEDPETNAEKTLQQTGPIAIDAPREELVSDEPSEIVQSSEEKQNLHDVDIHSTNAEETDPANVTESRDDEKPIPSSEEGADESKPTICEEDVSTDQTVHVSEGTANIVDDSLSEGPVAETGGEDRGEETADSTTDVQKEKTLDNGGDVAMTTDDTSKDDDAAAEETLELMDTQILESDDGNTQDSFADPSGGIERGPCSREQTMKEVKALGGLPSMRLHDECSMESFVSAKSSEFDYMDSLQGSPLPVKRVRELIDESPRASPVPSKRSRASSPASRDTDAGIQSDDDLGQFPAENVFEYQWPQDGSGDYYFVQEQISEFLGVKSFKRKYPDLERRTMEIKEKEFLMERGVVTEEQVTLGLTALRGEEVYDLMMKDYPNRYSEYARVIQEKQRQNISNRHKGYGVPAVDASKIKEYIKKAARQAADFNAALMREKREDRQYYFDLQTMQIHMPQSRMKKLTKELTKIGAYPVAVIPGQYQDYCRYYSSDELRYLPLNTAIYGPMSIRRETDYGPEVEEGDGEDQEHISDITQLDDLIAGRDKAPSDAPGDSGSQQPQEGQEQMQTLNQNPQPLPPPPPPQQKDQQQLQLQQQGQPPSQQVQQQLQQTPNGGAQPNAQQPMRAPGAGPSGPVVVPPGPASSGDESDVVRVPGPEALQLSMEAVVPITQPYQPKDLPDAICGLCLKDRHANTKGVPEELVHCSQCDNSGHPSCLEMNDELVKTIKTYPWQCMECKTCSQCGDPTHEDKMMFCDKCDRGYHTFCVGLTDIPTGLWLCPSCSSGGGIPPPVPPANPIPVPIPVPAGLPPAPLPIPVPIPVPTSLPPQLPQSQQLQQLPMQEHPPATLLPQPPQPPQQPPQPHPQPQAPLPPQQQQQPHVLQASQPSTPFQEPALGSKRKSTKR